MHEKLNNFLRAIAECFAPLSYRLSVHPSVCPSVTTLSPIKTVQVRITKSLLRAAIMFVIFSENNSMPVREWVPFE